MDLGSVSSWVAAVGTSGSLLIGISVARRQVRDAHAAQASRIHGWITLFGDAQREGADCVVLNGSSDPAYDVRLHVLNPEYVEVATAEFGMVVPGHRSEQQLDTVLMTGEWHSWIELTDAAGNRWTRGTSGRLHVAHRSLRERLIHGQGMPS